MVLLAGTAGCSDDFARVGGGLTTASLGLDQPSNQDLIIRKGASVDSGDGSEAAVRAGIRPVDVPPQSFPEDEASAAAATYAAPAVTGAALTPLAPARPATAAAEAPETVPVADATEKVRQPVRTKAAPAVARRVTKPKLAAAGVPVIPPAPKAPGGLRKIGEPLTTGSVKPATKRTRPAIEAPGGGYTVVSGDTLYAISRRYGVTSAAIMAANGLSDASLHIGQRLAIPGRGSAVTARAPRAVIEKPAAEENLVTSTVPRTTTARVAKAEPAAPAPAAAPAPTVAPSPVAAPKEVAAKPPAAKGFAWPARGRILATFGQRTPAGTNDGVDIALPEGSAVKAAADGIVLYSGSELKNFGNLVLVRHDDGWVSAYANAKSNLVKRGERVSRGQTIARSGQTGNATQPQLHFELRRNSKPVDPQKHLDG